MSRKKSTQHLVVQRMRPDRRGKGPLIEALYNRRVVDLLYKKSDFRPNLSVGGRYA